MIQSTVQMTNRDWIQNPFDIEAPSFSFPALVWPILRLTTSLVGNQSSPPWFLDCLEFISRSGQKMIIYQRPLDGVRAGIDDPEAIAHLAPIFQQEAHWAYGLRTVPHKL